MSASNAAFSLVERVSMLSKVYATIRYCFAHWHTIPDFDLEAAYQSALEAGLETADRRDFGLVMMRFLAQLQNGHSMYSDGWLWDNAAQPFPFLLVYLDNQWVVRESFVAEIRAGDVVSAINGQETEAFYQQVLPYISGSSDRERRTRFVSILCFFLPENYTVRLNGDREVEIRRDAISQPPRLSDRETEGRWIKEGKIGYIRIPTFNWPKFEAKAIEYVEQFKDAASLIVDVRLNTGGSTPSKLVERLMERPYRYWSESTAVTFAVFRYENEMFRQRQDLDAEWRAYMSAASRLERPSLIWPARTRQPENPTFTGKVIILIDRATGSAAEDFTVPFKENGRATLIGENSVGSTGQPYMLRPNEDIWIAVGAKRAYFADGSAFEGVGIAPDIEIRPTVDDLRAGRDVVLEEAMRISETA